MDFQKAGRQAVGKPRSGDGSGVERMIDVVLCNQQRATKSDQEPMKGSCDDGLVG